MDQLHDALPHRGATFIHISIGVADDFDIGAQFEAVEHNPRRLSHGVLHSCYVRVQTVEGRADQNRVVDRCTHFNAAFSREATGKPQHLGAVSLHGEVR